MGMHWVNMHNPLPRKCGKLGPFAETRVVPHNSEG